jgi:hypothetical protein
LEKNMKFLALSFVLAASMFATNSYADERQFIGTVGGGALGAIVGNHISGTPGAVVGGVAGAYVGHEITKPSKPQREVVYVKENRPVFYQPQPQPAYIMEEHRHHGHAYGHYKHHHNHHEHNNW